MERVTRVALSPDFLQRFFALGLALWLMGCAAFQYHPRIVFADPVAASSTCSVTSPGSWLIATGSDPHPATLHVALPPILEPFFLPCLRPFGKVASTPHLVIVRYVRAFQDVPHPPVQRPPVTVDFA